jgi:hypothetical protein
MYPSLSTYLVIVLSTNERNLYKYDTTLAKDRSWYEPIWVTLHCRCLLANKGRVVGVRYVTNFESTLWAVSKRR